MISNNTDLLLLLLPAHTQLLTPRVFLGVLTGIHSCVHRSVNASHYLTPLSLSPALHP